MKIFNAIREPEIVRMFFEMTGIKLNILISFFYIRNNVTTITHDIRHMINDLYLDSGAFSAKNKGARILLYGYLWFLLRVGHQFDQYFNLDDQFLNPPHNLANQRYLEEHLPQGFKRPIPVVHDTKNTFGELEMYVERLGHNYVALGSNSQKLKDEFFDRVKDKYPDLKLHMFGNLKREMLFKNRSYSADSAGFQHEVRFGSIYFWDAIDGKEYSIYLEGRTPMSKAKKAIPYSRFHHKKELDEFLYKTFKYTYSDLIIPNGEIAARIVNLYFFHQLETIINSRS